MGYFDNDRRYPIEDTSKIVKRYKNNPIITNKDVPFSCNSIFNAAVAEYNEEIIMIPRIEFRSGFSCLGFAASKDGINFKFSREPLLMPARKEPFKSLEKFGISDPRITKIKDTYYVIYAAYSEWGVYPIMMATRDFKKFERMGILSSPDNRNVVLFPEKIGGYYLRLERPMGELSHPNIWIARSPDLVHWGDFKPLMGIRPCQWDSRTIGPGAPPIKTEKGWLEIYHGVTPTCNGCIYRLGVVLLDLKNPEIIVGRGIPYILGPEMDYERKGDVNNAIFVCGIVQRNSREIKIYYGAADQCICLATAKVDDLVNLCLE